MEQTADELIDGLRDGSIKCIIIDTPLNPFRLAKSLMGDGIDVIDHGIRRGVSDKVSQRFIEYAIKVERAIKIE